MNRHKRINVLPNATKKVRLKRKYCTQITVIKNSPKSCHTIKIVNEETEKKEIESLKFLESHLLELMIAETKATFGQSACRTVSAITCSEAYSFSIASYLEVS